MDKQRNVLAPAGAVAIVDSEVPESGWLSVDLAAVGSVHGGFVEPQAQWPGPGGRRLCAAGVVAGGFLYEPALQAPVPEASGALTSAQLRAWVDRLRCSEKPLLEASDAGGREGALPSGLAAASAETVKERAIPDSALVAVGRTATRRAEALADSPAVVPARVIAFEERGRLRPPRTVPSSRGVRLILLCLAVVFFAAGMAHSFARWKPGRVIVVPATLDARSVIT